MTTTTIPDDPVTVTNQTELDAALAANAPNITINSPEDTWLRLEPKTNKSVIRIEGNSCVGPVGGSATIRDVGGSATISDVGGSATISDVRGSATISGVEGSATIRDVGGSATIRGVWDSATISGVGDSATISDVWGSATIRGVGGSATISDVWGSATISDVGGSATIRDVGGSATISDVGGSATIRDVGGSATIRGVGGSATIRLFGRAAATNVGTHVAVYIHDVAASSDGGVVIDLTKLDHSDPTQWARYHGAPISDGEVILHKAVRDNYESAHGFAYPIGETVTCENFTRERVCGGGLHVSPRAAQAHAYDDKATRTLRVAVKLTDLVPLDESKAKARALRVIEEIQR